MTAADQAAHLATFVHGSGIRVAETRKKVPVNGLCLVADFSPGPADAHFYVCGSLLARLARLTDGSWTVVGYEVPTCLTLPGLCFALASGLWEKGRETGHTITEGTPALT